jgi:4-amino-4-deoxy-L-arabinose transferase-like glycosyltransferase
MIAPIKRTTSISAQSPSQDRSPQDPAPYDRSARKPDMRQAMDHRALIFFAAFGLCLAIRLSTLGHLAFWFDETITADVVAGTWQNLVADRLANGHFPTYFAIVKALGLAGADEFWLRLPSAILDSLAGGLIALVAQKLSGRIGAVAAALLYALFPALIQYGQEARPYALMLFFLALAITGQMGLLMRDARPGRQAILATIGTIGAALALPAGIISVAMQHLALFACGFKSFAPREKRLWIRHIVVTWASIAAAATFLVPAVRQQAEKPAGLMKWQSELPSATRIREAFGETYGLVVPRDVDRFLPADWATPLALAFLALMAIGLLANRNRPTHRMLAVSALLTPLVFLVVGAFSATAGRYLIGMLPAALLLAAAGVASLLADRGMRIAVGATLALLLAGLSLQALDMLVSPRKFDWRPVANFLHDKGVRDTTILTDAPPVERALRHYADAADGVAFETLDPDRETIAALWAKAADRPIAFLMIGSYRTIPAAISRDAMVCAFPLGDVKLVMVARDLGFIPPMLRDCARIE